MYVFGAHNRSNGIFFSLRMKPQTKNFWLISTSTREPHKFVLMFQPLLWRFTFWYFPLFSTQRPSPVGRIEWLGCFQLLGLPITSHSWHLIHHGKTSHHRGCLEFDGAPNSLDCRVAVSEKIFSAQAFDWWVKLIRLSHSKTSGLNKFAMLPILNFPWVSSSFIYDWTTNNHQMIFGLIPFLSKNIARTRGVGNTVDPTLRW